MELSFLEKLDDDAIKEVIEGELETLSRLNKPEEIAALLKSSREFGLKLDAWVAAAKTGHHTSKDITSHNSAKDKKYDALAKQNVVLDIQFKLLNIIHCQGILANRGIRYQVNISKIPIKVQALFIAMYETKTGKKFVQEKRLGRMRSLGKKAKEGMALGIGRIKNRIKHLR